MYVNDDSITLTILCLYVLETCPGLTCQNGGSKNSADCTCDCTPRYKGDHCETKGIRMSPVCVLMLL